MTDTPERRDEPEEVLNYPEWALDDVTELLRVALFWEWSPTAATLKTHPVIKQAKESIEECALDNPDEIFIAIKAAYRGYTDAADHIIGRYARTYAEAHLTELVAHFQIDSEGK